MVLGTTYHNAARSALAVGMAWQHSSPLLAFRNAGLALLALTAAMVAGEACSSPAEKPAPSRETAAPEPSAAPEPAAAPAARSSKEEAKTAAPKPAAPESPAAPDARKAKTVLLPPIQALPEGESFSTTSRPSRSGSSTPPPVRHLPSPSLLEPPPSLGQSSKPDEEKTLEVIVGQPRIVTFPDVPHRVALMVNEKNPIATLAEVPHRPREWYIIGKKPGTTFLDVWLPDSANDISHRVLHYTVRIVTEDSKKEEKVVEKPRPELPKIVKPQTPASQVQTLPPTTPLVEKPRTPKPPTEPAMCPAIYQTLEQEINRTFPGSAVHLKLAGEKLVVSGTARNIFDALRILTVAREHAPGSKTAAPGQKIASPSLQATIDNYAQAGGPHVINLLRIPGEQQIMLRVIVAEVNRSAARSLGLDFGLGEQQATVLPNRSAAANGSSTVAPNGWIGQLVRTLQDMHYAQTLAEPTLTTLNGQAARFQAGGEFPIPVVAPSAQGAVQGVAFRSYGVRLSIQPVVADLDRIRLEVDAEVSGTDAEASTQVGNTAVPGLKVRNFHSTVELHEGDTLAVAGLVRGGAARTLAQNVRPGSGDPAAAEQELVVLISPLLLRTSSDAPPANANQLNPQEIEMYLRSRNTMVPRGDALYLIGPQGYAGRNR